MLRVSERKETFYDFNGGAEFFEKISIGIVIVTFGCFVLWYAASGPTMPFWDDWRYFLKNSMNAFGAGKWIYVGNDTLTIATFFDVTIFKAVNFNFAFARYLSLVWLLFYLFFAVFALRLVYEGYARAAATLLLMMPLSINGYWDDGTYIAYHQGLPVVFAVVSFYLVMSALRKSEASLLGTLVVALLSVVSGLTYISGFIPVLGLGAALLMGAFLEAEGESFKKKLRRLGVFLILLALGVLAIQFFMVSTAQGSLLEKSHASSVVTPFDARFWIFFLGVIGKGVGFRGTAIWFDALIAVVLFSPMAVIGYQIVLEKKSLKGAPQHDLLLITYVYSSVIILMYAAMVSYGRGGLLPVHDYHSASIVSKARFHHWWVSALAPFWISGLVWVFLSKFRLRFFSIFLFLTVALCLLKFCDLGLWGYEKVFSYQKNRELNGIACVRDNIDRKEILCRDFYPSNIKYAIDLVIEKKIWIGNAFDSALRRWRRGDIVDVETTVGGGHVDVLEVDGRDVRVLGWIPLNAAESDVALHVSNRLGDVDVSEYEYGIVNRPDVAKALQNDRLINSGFSVVFRASRPLDVDVVKKHFCIYGVKGRQAVSPTYSDGYRCK